MGHKKRLFFGIVILAGLFALSALSQSALRPKGLYGLTIPGAPESPPLKGYGISLYGWTV